MSVTPANGPDDRIANLDGAMHAMGLLHAARQAGLTTLTQLRALLLLGNRSRTVGELAYGLQISKAGASELADTLERAGLANRFRQLFNRHRTNLELTPAGRALLSRRTRPT